MIDIDIDPFEDPDIVDGELLIHNESLYALEGEVKDHSKRSAKYHRYAALAVKEMESIQLSLDIITAEIVDDICKQAEEDGRPIPPTGRAEVRRTQVPLDKAYCKLRRKLIKATSYANLFTGLTYDWAYRNKRLGELVRLSERTLWNEPHITIDGDGKVTSLDDRLARAEKSLEE